MEFEVANMKIAVTSRSFSRHTILRGELQARYPDTEITFNDDGLSLAGDALVGYLRGHDRAVIALERIDAAVLSALPELRVISKYGVGVDMLDLEAMEARGVELGWTPGVNRRSVAELVICFAIALLRQMPTAHREVLDGTWRQLRGAELSGRTVGIVGCGRVGKDVARLLTAFGCHILAHDIADYPGFYAEYGVTAVNLDNLLRASDVVTLHMPLDESTRNILSAERLAAMRPESILINTARGGLVDEGALKSMLLDGSLGAAAFDVFATEPPEDRELLELPNFIVTPHIGGSSEEAILAMGRAAIDGLGRHGSAVRVAAEPAPDWI